MKPRNSTTFLLYVRNSPQHFFLRNNYWSVLRLRKYIEMRTILFFIYLRHYFYNLAQLWAHTPQKVSNTNTEKLKKRNVYKLVNTHKKKKQYFKLRIKFVSLNQVKPPLRTCVTLERPCDQSREVFREGSMRSAKWNVPLQ